MNRPRPLPKRRADRGAALLVAIVLVAALAIIALSLVNRATNEIQSVSAKRRYDSSVSCADAAQALIRAQLQGTSGSLTMNVKVNDAVMRTGHYDNATITSVSAVTTGSPQAASAGGGDMANRIGHISTNKTYQATVVCDNANYPGHQTEVDVLFSFGI